MVARTANDGIKRRNEEFPGIYYRARRDASIEAEQGDIQSASPCSFALDRCVHTRTHAHKRIQAYSDNKTQLYLGLLYHENVSLPYPWITAVSVSVAIHP